MPKNEPQRGPSQEERRRRSANRPIGGGGTSQQLKSRKSDESYSNNKLQRWSSIIAIIMLVAMLLSLVPACYYSNASAAELPAAQGQAAVTSNLSLASARYLQRESAEVPPTASVTGPTAALSPDKIFSGVTGHYIAGPFLKFWQERGGLALFGYPLSEEFNQNGYTVQLFEKALLEAHPAEQNPQNQVQLGFLGRQLADARGLTFESAKKNSDSSTQAYFQETGQALGGGFKIFWDKHDGISTLGLPISSEINEGGATIQYFERGMLQLLPGSDTVEVANSGVALIEARNWPRPTKINFSLNLDGNEIYQGRTLEIKLEPEAGWQPLDLKGSIGDEALRLFSQGSLFKAFKAVPPDAPVQTVPLKLTFNDPGGRGRTFSQDIKVVQYDFPRQNLYLPDEKVELSDAANDAADNAQLASTYATFTPNILFTGKWAKPGTGNITTEFAEKRAYGDSTDYKYIHGGIDFAMPTGAPVYAPADGVVVFTADNMLVRGNAVAIDHGVGITSYYYHLSAYVVKPGDPIKKGQLIGRVGTTGRSNGPHLHWEVRVNGVITYPMLFINSDVTN